LLDIANRGYNNTNANDSKEILRVISEYTKALNLLDDYDHKSFEKIKGTTSYRIITYEECINTIQKLKFNQESDIFALERDFGLKSVLNNIYQSFGGNDVYPSLEEKGANMLYMIIKNHIFIDGNKELEQHYLFIFYNFIIYFTKMINK